MGQLFFSTEIEKKDIIKPDSGFRGRYGFNALLKYARCPIDANLLRYSFSYEK